MTGYLLLGGWLGFVIGVHDMGVLMLYKVLGFGMVRLGGVRYGEGFCPAIILYYKLLGLGGAGLGMVRFGMVRDL